MGCTDRVTKSMIGGRSILTQRGRGKDDLNGKIPKGKRSDRTKCVAGIKKKVENGKYRVEPKKVADKMVEDAVREVRSRRQ